MSVNSVLLVGRLGADPELRHTQGGKAVCHLRVATDRYRKQEGAEPAADWHSVVAWERTAELCHRYLRKGRELAVEGRLQTRRYEDPERGLRFFTEVIASRISFLGSRPAADEVIAGAPSAPTSLGAPADAGGAPPREAAGPLLPDDDIPF